MEIIAEELFPSKDWQPANKSFWDGYYDYYQELKIKIKYQTFLKKKDITMDYLREVKAILPLSKEEVSIFVKEYLQTKNPEMRNILLRDNLKVAVNTALKYRSFHSKFQVLVQEANLGLIQGLDKFKPECKVPLACYLSFWAKAYIIRYLTSNFKIVKIATTKSQRLLLFSLRKEKAKLEAQGKDVSYAALGKLFNLPESDIKEMDSRLSSDSKPIDINSQEEDEEKSPDSLLQKEMANQSFQKCLIEFKEELLNKNLHKHIIVLDHYFLKEPADKLEEIGARKDMQVSKQRVHQIEIDLKNKLKFFLEKEEI